MNVDEAYHKAYAAQKRMPELEHIIIKSGAYSCCYAHFIINGRWPEAETAIIRDNFGYAYAKNVIQGRWLEAEPAIMKHAPSAYKYAIGVIKGRWYEAEKIIASHHKYQEKYAQAFFDGQPIVTKDDISDFVWKRAKAQGYFVPASLFDNKASLLDMMVKE